MKNPNLGLVDLYSKNGVVYVNNKDGHHCAIEHDAQVGAVIIKHNLGKDVITNVTLSENPYSYVIIDTTLDLPELEVYRKMREAFDILGQCKTCKADLPELDVFEDESGTYCIECAIKEGRTR